MIPNRNINCGSAYIFRLEFGAWQQEAQLLPGNIAAGAHFGQAVQVSHESLHELAAAYTMVNPCEHVRCHLSSTIVWLSLRMGLVRVFFDKCQLPTEQKY